MTLAEIVFALIVAVTLAGAFLAITLKNVFYNALSLILCLFGVACIFVYLNSEFLAVMEVIVYIGAISIAIIFAIMLSRPMQPSQEPRSASKALRAGLLSVLLFTVLTKVVQTSAWPVASQQGDYSIKAVGKTLLTAQALPFEVISVILLIAIIGALVISGSKENVR